MQGGVGCWAGQERGRGRGSGRSGSAGGEEMWAWVFAQGGSERGRAKLWGGAGAEYGAGSGDKAGLSGDARRGQSAGRGWSKEPVRGSERGGGAGGVQTWSRA